MKIAVAYILFCIIYLGAPRVAIQPPRVLLPSAIDEAIPFLPWTIVVYLSQFAFLFLAIRGARDARPILTALGLATLMSAVVFIVYPTTIARPQTANRAFEALWVFDVPTNCFPSLHVALAVIAAMYWPYRRTNRVAIAWAAAIAISTLTTKQHYAADVVGGVGVVLLTRTATFAATIRNHRGTESQRFVKE